MRIPLHDTYHLRNYRDDDLRALVEYANNTRIYQFLSDRFPQPYERSDALAWIRYVREHRAGTVLAIANHEELIGNIGLYQQEDVYRCSAELGYWLGESFWDQGIATAAVNAMSELAFSRSDLVRIFACVFETNIGSCRVLEKAGFALEGVHRRAVLKDGRFLAEKLYGLLREEWQERRTATRR